MAIKDLKEIYKKNLKEAMRKYDNYAKSVGADTVVEFLLLSSSILKSCKKGTELISESLDRAGAGAGSGGAIVRSFNTDKTWLKIIKKRLKLIHRTKTFGNHHIGTWRQWQKKPKGGVYFSKKSKEYMSKGGRDDLILIIWDNDPTIVNKIVKDGTDQLLESLWEDFKKTIKAAGTKKADEGEDEKQTDMFGGFEMTKDVGPIDWLDKLRQRPSDKHPKGRLTPVKSVFRQGAAMLEHGMHSTKAMLALQRELKGTWLGFKGTYDYKILKITPWLMNNIDADWGQVVKRQNLANFRGKNVLTLRLGRNEPLATDLKPLMDKAEEYIREEVLAANGGLLADIKNKASKSLADQIAEDTIKGMMKPLTDRPRTKSGAFDMRFKVNRGLKNLKNFKPINRKEKLGKVGGKKAFSIKKARINIAGKLPKRTKVESGEGQQAPVSQAADLARLRTYIQGRLPAEVRRNMGRPALQNRTGRFSNSVKLLSLTEGRNTVMAKYTYLLRPYETFENKGKKRWPMAYNPKPLIAKSIRNLAQGRIEQKITVRRV